jgi:predicted nucleic acid-binding Zn ribbon protein
MPEQQTNSPLERRPYEFPRPATMKAIDDSKTLISHTGFQTPDDLRTSVDPLHPTPPASRTADTRVTHKTLQLPQIASPRASYFTELLLSTISGMESRTRIRESLSFAYWARVVGPQAAAATEVESVRDGVLIVRTKSSVWSHELTLHKEKLISGLNRMLGAAVIKEIVYKARGVKKAAVKLVEPDTPDQKELDAVLLEPAELAELDQLIRGLDSIASQRIREAIASRMTRDVKLRHWRLERGWKLCRNCTTLHRLEGDDCRSCSLNR